MIRLDGSKWLVKNLVNDLRNQGLRGMNWVAYDKNKPITGPWDLSYFNDKPDALYFTWIYRGDDRAFRVCTAGELISELITENKNNQYESVPQTNKIMNRNNLENLKDELRELRFDKKLAEEMEKNIQKGLPEFQLHARLPATQGQVDFTLHFKQSAQSDYYFLNKYDVMLNKAKPLEEGQKYLVISPGDQGKPVFRKFENPNEAINYFKEQKGSSELAVGKDPGSKTTLATMENDKVNYVSKDFQKVFYTPAVSQTIYVDKGKGFTADQASNLIQGRSVYRDDLLNVGGIPYKAWVALDFEKPKDRFQNYVTRQFHDPSYGFDLKKTLDKFAIKELEDPDKRQKLEESLKNGNRPLVTVVKEGQETKLYMEAVPRYSQINLYREDGKPEKREQFLKETVLEKGNALERKPEKEKSKEVTENQGMRI